MAAVVVTYNRQNLLRECLQGLLAQTHALDEIIVVDNASTDGTLAMLAAAFPGVTTLPLPKNIGGAGGFAQGMQLAGEKGYDWIWLMDDDLLVQPDALEHLAEAVAVNLSGKAFLGGLPQDQSGQLVWRLKIGQNWISHTRDLTSDVTQVAVDFLPFLGLLIPAQAIPELGLPRTDFFVYMDDVEYCFRARRSGYKIICVPQSRFLHPLPQRRAWRIFNKTVWVERFPAWKSYYEVRNRTLIGLEYEGIHFFYQLLPVVLLRIVLSLIWYPEERTKKIRAYLLGLWDGFRRKTGRQMLPERS